MSAFVELYFLAGLVVFTCFFPQMKSEFEPKPPPREERQYSVGVTCKASEIKLMLFALIRDSYVPKDVLERELIARVESRTRVWMQWFTNEKTDDFSHEMYLDFRGSPREGIHGQDCGVVIFTKFVKVGDPLSVMG
jgi:hypothetical protein